jgi:hypothetical protein
MTKICTKCALEQLIENFNKDKTSKDGHFGWCKSCVAENNKTRLFPVSVENKVCSKCGELKKAEEFEICSHNKTGLASSCKACKKKYYEEHKEEISIKQARYALEHPEIGKKAKTKYYEIHRDLVISRSAKHYAENKEEILARQKNDPLVPIRRKQRRLENLDESLKKEAISRDKRRATQREHINKVSNEWTKRKTAEDPNFKLASRLRSRLTKAINRDQKAGSAVRDLGCPIPELKARLELMFSPGMTWENWGHGEGKWNIDHILPLASFDLTDREQFLVACHYTNLQPLWHIDNMRKGKKIILLESMPKESLLLCSGPLGPGAET